MGRRNRDPWGFLNETPKTSAHAKRKAHWTMVFWLAVFKTVVDKIQVYEYGDPNWRFRHYPVVGPIYGRGLHVRARKTMRSGPDLQLLVSVKENSQVRICLGTETIYTSDCTLPDNMCQEELEEALLMHFGI